MLDRTCLNTVAEQWARHLDADDTYGLNDLLMKEFMTVPSVDWREWRLSRLREKLAEAKRNLADVIAFEAETRKDKACLPVYRSINVAPDWHMKPPDRPLGLCWSYDSEAAYPWNTRDEYDLITVTIEGRVVLEDIDWPVTLCQNALDAVGDDEREIRVKDEALIEVIAVYKRSRAADKDWTIMSTPHFSGKIIPAGATGHRLLNDRPAPNMGEYEGNAPWPS